MLRVRLTGRAISPVVAGSGDMVVVGRAPQSDPPSGPDLSCTFVGLDGAAEHTSAPPC